MTLLYPLDGSRGFAAEEEACDNGNTSMEAPKLNVQPDVRFLRAVLVLLALTTCLMGTAAVMAMP